MRSTIKGLLNDVAPAAIPPERWFQLSSIDENPEKPFGVFRLSGHTPGVTSRSATRRISCEVWVHDVPGDYSGIDGILNRVDEVFDSVVNASGAEGEVVSQARWVSRSPDLNDDGFGTICKMSSFEIIGKG